MPADSRSSAPEQQPGCEAPAEGERAPALIDTHCHLDMAPFDNDRDAVIERARACGFAALISVGSDLAGTVRAIELAGRHDLVHAAIGIHPHDAKDFSDDIYVRLKEWSRNAKVIAIGETGLDYHYDHSPRDVQRTVFRRHLELAAETGLPVVVHSREAKDDTLALLRASGLTRGVLHCFSGDWDMAEQAMALGFSISLAGPVTFRKATALKEIARLIPDDRILAETDAPYLTPEPYRGRRNEPAYLVNTLREIAALRGITFEDIARITTLNASRLFGISGMPHEAAIAYRIRDSLYLNITNRCTNLCSFCVRARSDFVKGHNLRLTAEPEADSLLSAIGDPRRYREIVFCGYGEPLFRLELVKDIARWVKERGGRVRINTNGHGSSIHRRDIVPELAGLVDELSVSLDAQDEDTYNRICRPAFPNAFSAVIDFIRRAAAVIPIVQATVVRMDGVDVEACRRLAESLGASLRVRELDVVG